MKTIQFLILVTFVALFASCATVPPKELVDARSAYQQASNGPAQQLTPAELHKAQEALALAEQSYLKNPNSYKTKDLAYVALRKAELAEALGAMAADKASKDKANADFQAKQTAIVKQGKEDLIASEKQGQQALLDAEKRNAEALAELAQLAAVKKEERGLVLTLSGGVLFQSAQSILMPSAQTKLDQVAKALLEVVPARNLIIEGYTDSQGTESYNQGLSQRRADAVRDYLVQKGYPSDRIVARGKGEGSPIANNASAEGRANNRRVEIVIEQEVATSND
ncbi:MAG: OmpA family protein [Syntrophales bacterium LBB04]|nr:OmpA family protein [Syntrophales bacterium LBB04]